MTCVTFRANLGERLLFTEELVSRRNRWGDRNFLKERGCISTLQYNLKVG